MKRVKINQGNQAIKGSGKLFQFLSEVGLPLSRKI
jgi:hypothetical protein